MATNYKYEGVVKDWVNNTGAAVSSNDLVRYGTLGMGVALVDIPNGGTGSVRLGGVFQGLPKDNHATTGSVAVDGQPAYWDPTDEEVYDAPGLGRLYMGVFDANAASPATTCDVRLQPFAAEGPRLIAATIIATMTVTAADMMGGNLSLLLSNAAVRVVNLPSVEAVPRGTILRVRKTGGGAAALTLTPDGDEQIAGGATHALIDADNDYAMFQSTGAAWLLVDSAIA